MNQTGLKKDVATFLDEVNCIIFDGIKNSASQNCRIKNILHSSFLLSKDYDGVQMHVNVTLCMHVLFK